MYQLEKYLEIIDDVLEKGPYKPTWESLSAYELPTWYRNAKFGIFIHWGIYSVPAFSSEWYSRNMYIQGSPEYEHHIKTYGEHKNFGYKDFIPMFKAEKFNPDEWAELFKEAGANYVVPVAEHHDGFQMYRSEISHWNAYEMGPERDVLGELKTACQKREMQIGASSHRIEHWFFMGHGKEFESDIKDPMQRGDFYWLNRKIFMIFSVSRSLQKNFFRTGWCVPVKLLTGIIRKSCILTGGSSTVPASLI